MSELARFRATMTEAEVVATEIEYAHLGGGLAEHFRPCRRLNGRIVTPVEGDEGGPDLVIVVGEWVHLIECKRERGKLRPDQERWLSVAERVKYASYRVVRPSDLEQERLLLTRRA